MSELPPPGKTTVSAVTASTHTSQPSDPKILLAEDNRVNQKVALLLLKKWGYQADVADNGIAVLQALEKQAYQIILMDVQMPTMDGITATQRIHERYPPHQRPFIVAITASAIPGDREECLAAGMQAYLVKPIDATQLLQVLTDAKQWLQELRSTAAADSPLRAGQAPPATGLPEGNIETAPVLEQAVVDALWRMAGDQFSVVLAEIVEDFLADMPGAIATLLAAMEQKDAVALRQAAHRLRSSSANLGAARLSALGHTLEDQARAGTIPDRTQYEQSLHTEFELAQTALLQLMATQT